MTDLIRSTVSSRGSMMRRGSVLKGCLIAVAIFAIIAVGIGVWVAMSWRGWTATAMTKGAEAMVAEAPIDQPQKDRINARVKGVAADFESKRISMEQLGEVMKALVEGPLPNLAIVTAGAVQIEKSTMTPEEKAEAKRSVERFSRGIVEGKISQGNVVDAMAPITNRQPNGQMEMKQNLTVEELRSFAAQTKSKADEAAIPDEAYTVNFADEVDKAIDKALGVPAPL